jgi:hypothetical protein
VAGRGNANSTGIDSAPHIQAAIDYISGTGGGEVLFRDNYYPVGATLVIPTRGIILRGKGDEETYVFAKHSSGPVLHVMAATNQVHNMVIGAADARRDGAAGTNFGILYQGADDTARLQNQYLHAVRVQNQPSHGMYASHTAYTGTVDRCWFQDTKGHGVLVDQGTGSGHESLTDVSGLVTFNECQVKANGGNGYAFGNSGNTTSTTQCLRVILSNCEIGNNASDPAMREQNAQVFMYGATDMNLVTNVFTSPNVANGTGVHIQGARNVFIKNNRFISVDVGVVVDSNPVLETIGVFIEGFSVIDSLPMDEFLRVQNTTGDATKEPRGISYSNYNYVGGMDRMVKTGTGMDPGAGPWRVPEMGVGGRAMVCTKPGAQVVANSTTLVPDDALKFWVVPDERDTFLFVVRYSGPPAAALKLQLTGPAGCDIKLGVAGNLKLDASDTVVAQDEVGADTDMVLGCAASPRVLTLVGSVLNGSTAGSVGLQWAQDTADAGDTSVLADSYVRVDRVPV